MKRLIDFQENIMGQIQKHFGGFSTGQLLNRTSARFLLQKRFPSISLKIAILREEFSMDFFSNTLFSG